MGTSFFNEFIAGNIGGVLGISVVYPLDTAKVRLQVTGIETYKSSFDVLSSMIKKDGLFSIYRGLLSPATGFGVTFAISFR
jgi:solute carrier family 25 carnitine/acylcarnitine transporter 20/29